MKVVFVGPSLPDASELAGPEISVRKPAVQGDVIKAVREGATSIGLIDGQFEFVAPVWHKELLYALSKDIPVYGAASMGALRAAECAAYGMIGIGKIFQDYMSGKRYDDADVALIHSPEELGYIGITVPLVNVDATLENALSSELISEPQFNALTRAAREIFFKDRTWSKLASVAGAEAELIKTIINCANINQKREDALALIDVMRQSEMAEIQALEWEFNATPLWRKMYS